MKSTENKLPLVAVRKKITYTLNKDNEETQFNSYSINIYRLGEIADISLKRLTELHQLIGSVIEKENGGES